MEARHAHASHWLHCFRDDVICLRPWAIQNLHSSSFLNTDSVIQRMLLQNALCAEPSLLPSSCSDRFDIIYLNGPLSDKASSCRGFFFLTLGWLLWRHFCLPWKGSHDHLPDFNKVLKQLHLGCLCRLATQQTSWQYLWAVIASYEHLKNKFICLFLLLS